MAANAAKKGAKITKIAREIQVAAKMGGADPAMNARLRAAISDAKENSVSKDTIERAIKKGAGIGGEGEQIEEITYEGYGPHQVGILVECQTDNRHRTAADIRNLFNKNGGSLGEAGSVAWMFERIAFIEASHANVADAETEAIEAGANEVEKSGADVYHFTGAPEDLKAIEVVLKDRGWTIKSAELSYKAKNQTELTDEQKKEVIEFMEILDDNDDTHRLHATVVL